LAFFSGLGFPCSSSLFPVLLRPAFPLSNFFQGPLFFWGRQAVLVSFFPDSIFVFLTKHPVAITFPPPGGGVCGTFLFRLYFLIGSLGVFQTQATRFTRHLPCFPTVSTGFGVFPPRFSPFGLRSVLFFKFLSLAFGFLRFEVLDRPQPPPQPCFFWPLWLPGAWVHFFSFCYMSLVAFFRGACSFIPTFDTALSCVPFFLT